MDRDTTDGVEPEGDFWLSWETLEQWAFEPGVVLLGPPLTEIDRMARHRMLRVLRRPDGRIGVQILVVLRSGLSTSLTISAAPDVAKDARARALISPTGEMYFGPPADAPTQRVRYGARRARHDVARRIRAARRRQ